MGSGELTATMVEVHKELLRKLGSAPKAVFLDTPAGFQLNVDQISQKAVEYFRSRVESSMSVASFKSKETSTPYEAEQAFHTLRNSDFILIGPGSPTYAVRQWLQTPIPEILTKRVENGGCLVAASAAALTVGRFTLPVYEIYKVGQSLHWVEGMDILGHFGLNLVVVPHWNNAEGGTHDTRFCFVGEARFRELEALLPEDAGILGLDEHTACVIDIERAEAVIKGMGRVILRHHGSETAFEEGELVPLSVFRGEEVAKRAQATSPTTSTVDSSRDTDEVVFWDRIHAIEATFHAGLERHEAKHTSGALLELDRTIWQAHQNLESDQLISEARETLRDLVVLLGVKLESLPRSKEDCVAPLVEELLALRNRFRQEKQWAAADAIRDSLQQTGIVIEDTEQGSRWNMKDGG
jgi:cyanophycinase-like exopeptidase